MVVFISKPKTTTGLKARETFSNLPGNNANTTGKGQPQSFRKLLSRGNVFETEAEKRYHVTVMYFLRVEKWLNL